MSELSGIPIPSIDWESASLVETFRHFKRTCELIFNGPLEEKTEKVKIQYLLLWVGDTGRDIRDSWNLSLVNK